MPKSLTCGVARALACRATPGRGVGAAAIGWLVGLAVLAGPAAAQSAAPVDLLGAGSFAVLGGTTVTSAGTSTITGDLGVSPGTAITGFPPGAGTGVLHGTMHAGDGVAAQAHADLASAYDAIVLRPKTADAGVLDNLTLTPGVYRSGAALSLAGTLTLDAEGDPDAVFIFQAGSTLGTAASSAVALTDGAQACNVFWQVGSSATLGANSLLTGSILAATSITMGAGIALDGRALARDGAVTMDNDAVTAAHCDAAGELSNTAPAIAPFTADITGLTQEVRAAVGGWSVTDATGSDAGYRVTVAASAPEVDGSVSAAGTGAQLTLTPVSAVPDTGNEAAAGPVAAPPQVLSTTPATIADAQPGSGQGKWIFPPDAGAIERLAIVIPGDARAGVYSSTLTFTTAPPAG